MPQFLMPSPAAGKYKGQAGKVGVVGGCREYTGAPYFAAMSALRVGADLSHVFCTNGAATIIKGYSPELIVHPCLPDAGTAGDEPPPPERRQAQEAAALDVIRTWMDRFDVLVIGPGLGRDEAVLSAVAGAVQEARARGIPLVIDADGLWLVNQRLELVQGYANAVLTPNVAEFKRLAGRLEIDPEAGDALEQAAARLQGPVLVRKGGEDRISDGTNTLACDEEGSLRRAGGQASAVALRFKCSSTLLLLPPKQLLQPAALPPALVCN